MTYPPVTRRIIARSSLVLGTALVSWLGVHSAAQAGLPEVISSLAQHPTDPSVLALLYDSGFGGVLYSADGGKTFRIRPALTATTYGLTEQDPVAITSTGNVLVGSMNGLLESDQHGCGATLNATVGEAAVNALAMHPRDASVMFFVSSNAENGAREGIWKRAADGTVTPTGPATQSNAARFYVSSMRVVEQASATDKLRFIQTGTRYGATSSAPSSAVFRYSDNLGETWTEHTIPGAGSPKLMAVDPLDSNRAIVAIGTTGTPDPQDPILLTLNSGQTFTSYIEGVTSAAEAVVAPDGRAWLSGLSAGLNDGSGLWFAARIGDKPEKVLDGGVHCLGYNAAANNLFICRERELGLFDLEKRSFCRMFGLTEVVGLVSCPSEKLEQSQRAKEQLCGAWCEALHLASTPLCSIYNDERGAYCGLAARKFDKESGYEEPPPSGPRCAGFEPVMDAAVESAPPDAGAAEQKAPPQSEANLQPSDGDAAVSPSKRRGGSGCSLATTGSSRPFELMSMAVLLYALRRRLFRAASSFRAKSKVFS